MHSPWDQCHTTLREKLQDNNFLLHVVLLLCGTWTNIAIGGGRENIISQVAFCSLVWNRVWISGKWLKAGYRDNSLLSSVLSTVQQPHVNLETFGNCIVRNFLAIQYGVALISLSCLLIWLNVLYRKLQILEPKVSKSVYKTINPWTPQSD